MNRNEKIKNLTENPQVDVLIIGGGINGVGTFRDLALQGVRVALVEKSDYCAGASAGSSHMLHGGIRYLENAEFRLVREALHERNLLLKNAPHYAKPLPTTIPIFRWFSGLFNAPFKFVGLINKPSERGAIVIKLGLIMYDLFTGSQQTMPFHTFHLRKKTMQNYPKLNPDAICTATYYDAYMPYPERICLDIIQDAEADSREAIALNYMRVVDGKGDTVTIRDELTQESLSLKPKVVINAGGPWIDFVNDAIQQKTRFIGGTKGSHLMLDHPELHEATNGHEIFFENDDGRIVLIFPLMGKVMIGTTDIRIDNPDDAVCTQEETEYMLDMVKKVFPSINVAKEQIVFQFSGVRPLPASEDGYTGNISRDHSIRTVKASERVDFPVHSLIGGKWTTFRAFSAQTTDVALQDLNKTRQDSTEHLPIGGGKDYPDTDEAKDSWLKALQQETSLPYQQLEQLFERYGTKARDVARFMSQANDTPLRHLPEYSQREIRYMAEKEQVERITDIILRRSAIAILGHIHQHPQLIEEIGTILAEVKGWDETKCQSEVQYTQNYLEQWHGLAF